MLSLLLLLPLSLASTESRVYCSTSYYCSSSETCCPAPGTNKWMCCPFGAATCCSDQAHCCPTDFPVCDTKGGKCLSSGLMAFAYSWAGRDIAMGKSQEAMPQEFDARKKWPGCVNEKAGQTLCDNYAMPPISSVYDRICIAGKGKFDPEVGLKSIREKVSDLSTCDDTLFDYAVLHSATYGLPYSDSLIRISVENISLAQELRIKREIAVRGPVSIKLEDRSIGKVVGWGGQDWVVIRDGQEVRVPQEARGLVTAFTPILAV